MFEPINKIETIRIFNEVLKPYGAVEPNESSNILHHSSITCSDIIKSGSEYIDAQKNHYTLRYDGFHLSYKADIDKFGTKLLTYSLNCGVYFNQRLYRHKYEYEKEMGFYIYDIDLEKLKEKFLKEYLKLRDRLYKLTKVSK